MNFSGKNAGVGCHFFLQGIFLTQGLNLRLLCLPALAGSLYLYEPPGKHEQLTWLISTEHAPRGWAVTGHHRMVTEGRNQAAPELRGLSLPWMPPWAITGVMRSAMDGASEVKGSILMSLTAWVIWIRAHNLFELPLDKDTEPHLFTERVLMRNSVKAKCCVKC